MKSKMIKVEIAIKEALEVDLNTRIRKRHIIDARIIFSLICRDVYGLTYQKIGDYTERGHTTILYHVRSGRCYLKNESKFKEKYKKVVNLLPDQMELQLRATYNNLLAQTREAYKNLRRLQLENRLKKIQ